MSRSPEAQRLVRRTRRIMRRYQGRIRFVWLARVRAGTHDIDVDDYAGGPLWQAYEKKEHRRIALYQRSHRGP